MNFEVIDIIIPSIAFFIAFFLIFSIIQLLIILALQNLLFKDKKLNLKNSKVRHVQWGVLIFIGLYLLAAILFTKLPETLYFADTEVQVFAIEMLLVLLLIYYFTTKNISKKRISYQIQKYLYLFISGTIFVMAVSFTNLIYEPYKNYINANLTHPVSENISYFIESRKRRQLLKEFRSKYLAGQCNKVDYATRDIETLGVNFVYVTTDPGLKRINRPINVGNEHDFLEGHECTNETEIFLLTKFGQWYWVIPDGLST